MNIVVDASVGVKWLVDEVQSTDADALLLSEHTLLVPDLFTIEVFSALGKKVGAGDLTRAESLTCVDNLGDLMRIRQITVLPTPEVQRHTLEIANEIARSYYDCLYLGLALSEGAKVVTADKRFYNGLQGYVRHVVLLGEPLEP